MGNITLIYGKYYFEKEKKTYLRKNLFWRNLGKRL